MDSLLHILFSALTSFTITLLAIPKIIHFSNLSRLFAYAGERDLHTGKIPIFGGIAIFSGTLLSLLIWSSLENIQFIIVSLIIIFIIGIIDDLLNLSPYRKIFGQVISILIIVFFQDLRVQSFQGLFGIELLPFWFSIFFTVFIVIVIINAFNLIDGIDGLAASIGIVSSFIFGVLLYLNNNDMFILSFSLSGSLFAFLRYNISPARIFMGDTGSLVIGFLLAIFSIEIINEGIVISSDLYFGDKGPFIAITLLCIPLYDTFRLFFIRVLNGENPLHPDRNHLHHALIDIGLTHNQTTILLSAFTILVIVLSSFILYMPIGFSIFILTVFVLSCMTLPFLILRTKKKNDE